MSAHILRDRRLHDPRKMGIDWREKCGARKVEVRGSSSGLGVAPPDRRPDPRRAFSYPRNLQSIRLRVRVVVWSVQMSSTDAMLTNYC